MGFKLAHLADIHAGYSTSRHTNNQSINLRVVDGYIALQKIITQVIEAEADAAVLCGDIFHGAHPEIRDIVYVQKQLRRLADANIPVYALAGNHDVTDMREAIAASRVLDDPIRNIHAPAEAYKNYRIADGINLHMVQHQLYSAQAELMSTVKPINGEINIFSTHGSLYDPVAQTAIRTGAPREIVIPESILNGEDWTYRLLGHIHTPGWIGTSNPLKDTAGKKTYYAGSIVRRGFSDPEAKALGRGWTLWTIGDDGTFHHKRFKVAQRPQFDFPTIDASKFTSTEISDKIIARLKETQTDGNNFIPNVAPILRQCVKNISPQKYQSLDLKTIGEQSLHAMTWSIKQLSVEMVSSDGNNSTIELSQTEEKSILEVYDAWVANAKSIQGTDKELRTKVEKMAKEFIEKGQELALERE